LLFQDERSGRQFEKNQVQRELQHEKEIEQRKRNPINLSFDHKMRGK